MYKKLGVYHLKDKEERNGLIIDFEKIEKNIGKVKKLHIAKVPTKNNRIAIVAEVDGEEKPEVKETPAVPQIITDLNGF